MKHCILSVKKETERGEITKSYKKECNWQKDFLDALIEATNTYSVGFFCPQLENTSLLSFYKK